MKKQIEEILVIHLFDQDELISEILEDIMEVIYKKFDPLAHPS